MYERSLIEENKEYEKDGIGPEPPSKGVIFHNSSEKHITMIAYDANTGSVVEVMIRKDAMPQWLVISD